MDSNNASDNAFADFADPQGEFSKFHSLLGAVSVHVQDKTFTVLPLPSIIFLESAKI